MNTIASAFSRFCVLLFLVITASDSVAQSQSNTAGLLAAYRDYLQANLELKNHSIKCEFLAVMITDRTQITMRGLGRPPDPDVIQKFASETSDCAHRALIDLTMAFAKLQAATPKCSELHGRLDALRQWVVNGFATPHWPNISEGTAAVRRAATRFRELTDTEFKTIPGETFLRCK